jgi:hypothetical protein
VLCSFAFPQFLPFAQHERYKKHQQFRGFAVQRLCGSAMCSSLSLQALRPERRGM